MKQHSFYSVLGLFFCLILLGSCQEAPQKINYPKTDLAQAPLIPKPLKVVPTHTAFGLDSTTAIFTTQSASDFEKVAQFLAETLKTRLNIDLAVNNTAGASVQRAIYINKVDQLDNDATEAYQIDIRNDSILLNAKTAAGAFRGVQTLRQLIPTQSNDTLAAQPIWPIPSGQITDAPNFAYRGAMLDVARHFFSVAEVKRFIDQLAYYKYNSLHMHLTDDQGWRIEIKSWPKLTTVGSTSEVGGGTGGFFTQEDFKELVAYAADRHMQIIPEVDMPGHTNAANLSYPIFHAGGKADTPRVRTDMKVGYSSFDARKDTVYAFLDDVVREIAAISPSPYFHIGGDESHVTPKKDYIHFVEKIEKIVQKHGKQAIGWNEIAQANISNTTIGQLWNEPESALKAAKKGSKIILSPGKKIYLDMKYDSLSKHGLNWAGYIPVDVAYNWNPETYVEGLPKDLIMGIEAPLWSETISNSAELEYLAFPRAIGYAELGWTPSSQHNWESYKARLQAQVPYLKRNNINFYQSPLIDWE